MSFAKAKPIKSPLKRSREGSTQSRSEQVPDVALAAIVSSRRQKDVSEFIGFLLNSLEKNSEWLNTIVSQQTNFRCALMVGAGPNRYQLQEIIYPSNDLKAIKLEVELKESEDHDKIAVAALLKLTSSEMSQLLNYVKTRLNDNLMLKADLLTGKSMGISFALLRPLSEKQYRLMERIVLTNSMRYMPMNPPSKKRWHEEKSLSRPVKRIKRVA